MFESRPLNQSWMTSEQPRHNYHTALRQKAIRLFERSRWQSWVDLAKRILLGHERALLDLNDIPSQQIISRHYRGIRAVNIDDIRGSMGRCSDFDRSFHPLSDRAQNRWTSVAMARWQDIPLDAVQLVQVGDSYFVQDGHHRISVARALGETMIDAEIYTWEIEGALAPTESRLSAYQALPAM